VEGVAHELRESGLIAFDGPLEAQTSIKRGYLNLLHAREAIAREASRVDGLQTRHHTM
jgi:hypothetical protein